MQQPVTLDAIRSCLEGVVPATVATCSLDGVPNATYVSQMQYVDARHVALSFQFFSKTRENILANPQATALVIEPVTGASYRLDLLYLRTETEGALFQSMKAKLAGIASHTGMSGVFRLQGADVYRVLGVHLISPAVVPAPVPRRSLLNALRSACTQLAECASLEALFDQALALLGSEFGIEHALLLIADAPAGKLYTVASRGYPATGVGSEIAFGDGVIGVAAQYRTPIRISHMTLEYRYGCAARDSALSQGGEVPAHEAEIPFPGLAEPHSQLAVPILAAGRLLGVLCVESRQDLCFSYDAEDALVALAAQLGVAIHAFQQEPEAAAPAMPVPAPPAAADGQPIEVRHYRANDSVFVGDAYLIKGVPGAILWKLLKAREASGRQDFSNRELRMAPELRLPEIADNLEARLILLQRRLAERCPQLAIEKTGRGQFRLKVMRALTLVEAEG